MASPQEVNEFHFNDDCDASVNAHHHTLGLGPGQAAPGPSVRALLQMVEDLIARVEALEETP